MARRAAGTAKTSKREFIRPRRTPWPHVHPILAAVVLAPLLVVPAIVLWSVLAATGKEIAAPAVLLLAGGAFVEVARRRPRNVDTVPPQHRGAHHELVDFLLQDSASGGDFLWSVDEDLVLRDDLPGADDSAGASLAGTPLVALLVEGTPGALAVFAAIGMRVSFRDVVVEVRTAGTTTAWWRLGGRPLFGADGGFTGYNGIGADVTALRQAQARIAHLATHDALTGLANRETFQAHAGRACSEAAGGGAARALLLLDLDGFKQVNDSLGHGFGDELLTAVAAVLTRTVPDGALVARLGGDEFAILYAPDAPSGPTTLAQAAATAIAAPFVLGEHQARIGVSIGIALSPEHAVDPRDLARKADLALYRAKAEGGHRAVVFEEAFQRERDEKLRLELDIGLALERDEFTLHYQPLLDVAAGRIASCEALIRWRSPTRGAVSPAAFIPAAEGAGLIVAIGRFVLERACRDAAGWHLPVSVAVNISPPHLRDPAFKSHVVQALKASGLPPSRLEIEITEGVFLDRATASLEALTWLRERGIKVALDDFGTGFSSLNYLVDCPVDKIKIDRSFVAGLVTSAQSRAVVDAILMLARNLGLRVVAEGVETTEQALALKLRRCDDLQGYLICRPQPAEAIDRLLTELPASLRVTVPALLDSSLAAALAMKRSA